MTTATATIKDELRRPAFLASALLDLIHIKWQDDRRYGAASMLGAGLLQVLEELEAAAIA